MVRRHMASHFPFGSARMAMHVFAVVFILLACFGKAGPAIAATSAEQLYNEAIAARLVQDFDEASDLLEQALLLDPANADAHVLLGYSYLALGETPRARASFEAALRIAPDYEDARLGLAYVAFRVGDRPRASALVEQVMSVQPNNEDAAALWQQLQAPSAPKWRLDAGAEYHSLTGNRANWYEAVTTLSYAFDESTVLSGTVRAANRGTLSDTQLIGQIYKTVSPQLSAFAMLAATPEADFFCTLRIRLRHAGDCRE